MKRRKKLFAAGGILLTMAFATSGTWAYYQDSVTVQNHISTGDVNIGIQEYQQVDGKEILYDTTEERIVLPSEEISKIPRITNYAETCYVRAKVTYQTKSVSDSDTKKEEDAIESAGSDVDETEKTEVCLSDENISGISDQWIRKGEYYYYTEPLKNGESVDLFQKVTIPAEWTEATSGTTLGITVTAEAIQAANFTPDFQTGSPWGDQEMEQCVHEQNGTITEVQKQYQTMRVTYEGAARNLVAVPEDFFTNLDQAMPGDVISDTITISNTTDTTAEFFFRTETPGQLTEEELDLLQQFQLTIEHNGQNLYSGDLEAAALNKAISLGTYQAGESGTLRFTLSLPKELKNDYARRESFVNWIFSVQGEEEIDQMAAPKTGLQNPSVYIPLLLAAVSIISTGILCRKEKKRHEMER